MARASELDKMSYAQLLALEERIQNAIKERRAEEAKAVKDQMAALPNWLTAELKKGAKLDSFSI